MLVQKKNFQHHFLFDFFLSIDLIVTENKAKIKNPATTLTNGFLSVSVTTTITRFICIAWCDFVTSYFLHSYSMIVELMQSFLYPTHGHGVGTRCDTFRESEKKTTEENEEKNKRMYE